MNFTFNNWMPSFSWSRPHSRPYRGHRTALSSPRCRQTEIVTRPTISDRNPFSALGLFQGEARTSTSIAFPSCSTLACWLASDKSLIFLKLQKLIVSKFSPCEASYCRHSLFCLPFALLQMYL